jgi:protein-tyrosine phosphatase
MTDATPPRRLPFVGAVNFRDLGGYETDSGARTCYRRLYRSDALHRLTDNDLRDFHHLGIRAVYDLRSDEERRLHPDPMESHPIDVEASVPRPEFEDGSWLRDAKAAKQRLLGVYQAILSTGGPQFGRLLRGLANETRLPAVFHCAGGKDRTGLAAALVLGVLHVSRATILDDYELTGSSQTPERHAEVLERFVSLGMTNEVAVAYLGAHRWILETALEWLDERYGGTERYIAEECGVGDEVVAALRAALLT